MREFIENIAVCLFGGFIMVPLMDLTVKYWIKEIKVIVAEIKAYRSGK